MGKVGPAIAELRDAYSRDFIEYYFVDADANYLMAERKARGDREMDALAMEFTELSR